MQKSANLNAYWLLLKDLSTDEKLSLIELLVKSIPKKRANNKISKKPQSANDNDWVYQFAGTWGDMPQTAEEIIEFIENARTMGRPVEML